MDVTTAFERCLNAPVLDLGRAALLIAQEEYPTLDIDAYLARLDRLADQARSGLGANAATRDKLRCLNQTLFVEEGFTGNATDYYDPRNSFLNDVLDRKLGIPITLSVLYMEVGRRLDMPLEGVGFPGHFLVKLRLAEQTLVLDPFFQGVALGEADLKIRCGKLFPTHKPAPADLRRLLTGIGKREILARMLRNLKAIYLHRCDLPRALSASNRLLLATPDCAADIRDRGTILERLECAQAAANDYRRYLELLPHAPDRAEIHARLRALQPLRNRLN